MNILAIETSCDETAVAILECEGGTDAAHIQVRGNALFSQAHLHAAYGGVFPTLAKREHQKNLVPLTIQALTEAQWFTKKDASSATHDMTEMRDKEFQNAVSDFIHTTQKPPIDLIAVTRGPGLEPALWTGITFAEALAQAWAIPIIGVDHMEGHIVSGLLNKTGESVYTLPPITLPLLALLISGGHTQLMLMDNWFSYTLIGQTRDDAVGEAFDKVARLLGLPYPGGPQIDEHAARARTRQKDSGPAHSIIFPRPMAQDASCDFSFSGLKTAVRYKLRDMPNLTEVDKEHVAEAFEDAARDIMVIKTRRALAETRARTFTVGGGVAANRHIRDGLIALIEEEFPNTTCSLPDKTLTGDNAIMIGAAGYLRSVTKNGAEAPLSALGNASLG